MTTDDSYFRTIFWTYLQVIRCIGEEKPARFLYRWAPSKIAAGTILMHVVWRGRVSNPWHLHPDADAVQLELPGPD